MKDILTKRKLLDGTEVPSLSEAVVLKITTKCPNKWKLVDMETGEEYIGNRPEEHEMFWKKVTDA